MSIFLTLEVYNIAMDILFRPGQVVDKFCELHLKFFVDPCYLVDCAPGYECLVYEATGEAYCSPNCEELNPCAPDEQCVLTTVYCIRAPCPPILSCQGIHVHEVMYSYNIIVFQTD